MTVDEIYEWIAFFNIYGWSDWREDYRAALIAYYATASSPFIKSPPNMKQIMRAFDFDREPQSQKDIAAIFRAYGKHIERRMKKGK